MSFSCCPNLNVLRYYERFQTFQLCFFSGLIPKHQTVMPRVALHAARACVALGDDSRSEPPDDVCAGNQNIFAYVKRVCVHVVLGPAHAPVSSGNKVPSFINRAVGNTKTNARQGQRHTLQKTGAPLFSS